MRPSIATTLARGFGFFVPALVPTALAIALAGCASSSKLAGPNWNLTGGKGATPIPERPLNPPQAAGLPTPERQPPVYRGGRDPVSGRAPTWGGPPAGLDQRPPAAPGQPGQSQPSSNQGPPIYTPVYSPPASAPARGASAPMAQPIAQQTATGGRRTVEVRPGQSLASIAADNRVSIASLMHANGLRDPYVIPGQTLAVPSR